MAATSSVSRATVVRFPVLLGTADHNELRGSMHARVNHDLLAYLTPANLPACRCLPPKLVLAHSYSRLR